LGSTSNKWQKSGAFNDSNWMISGKNRKDLIQMQKHLYNLSGKQDGINFTYDANGIELDIDFNQNRQYPVRITDFADGEYECSIFADGIDEDATDTGKALIIGGDSSGIWYNSSANEQPWFMARMISEDEYETTAELVIPDLESVSTVASADLYLMYDASANIYQAIRADDLIVKLLELVASITKRFRNNQVGVC